MIAPLQCVSCNAPLAVVDNASAACAFCGTSNPIPQQYRDELRLTRELDDATCNAAREWSRLNQISLPRWWFICAVCAPLSYWSMLITLDVWVLALCLFWYVREAFLPPATIEELEALIDGPVESATEDGSRKAVTPASRTRGWYDRAFEKRNFVIPATVALMFLAIELLVLNG